MRYVGAGDVDDLALGAAVSGGGGGGDGYVPRQMLLAAIDRYGPVPLVDAAELDPEAQALPVLSAGAPSALVEMFHGERESARLRELVEQAAGRGCAAVLPVQPGPVNALIPLVVAAQLGLPCLDADVMLRCFPTLEMTLFTLAGISPSPVVVVDGRGTSVVLTGPDNAVLSQLLRSCMPRLGLVAMISTYLVTVGECARIAAPGGLTGCLRRGRDIRLARTRHGPDHPDFVAALGGVRLFTGVVAELVQRTGDGFALGVLSIEARDDPGRMLRVDFQNENLVAAEDGVVVVTVPDLINLVDLDTGTLMQTVDVAVGQRVHVLATPVDPRWHTEPGIALVGPRAFGYDIDPVRTPHSRESGISPQRVGDFSTAGRRKSHREFGGQRGRVGESSSRRSGVRRSGDDPPENGPTVTTPTERHAAARNPGTATPDGTATPNATATTRPETAPP